MFKSKPGTTKMPKKFYYFIAVGLFIISVIGMIFGFISSWNLYAVAVPMSILIVGALVLWGIRVTVSLTQGSRQTFQNSSHAEIANAKTLHAESMRELRSLRSELDRTATRVSVATPTQSTPISDVLDMPSMGNTFNYSGRFFGIGPDYEYAERIQNDVSGFETFALRSKSLRIRDAFALNVTRMQFDYVSLMRLLNSGRAGYVPGLVEASLGSWNKESLLALGRIVANQRAMDSDAHDAAAIFWWIEKTWGSESLGKTGQYLYVEILQDLGKAKEVNAKLKAFKMHVRNPVQNRLVKSNMLLRGIGPENGHDWSGWLDSVNSILLGEGLASISIESGDSPAIDRICVNDDIRTVSGPRVSVIVPTFNGGRYVSTAIESLLAQSWSNLEIIVVDDCSDAENYSILEEIASRDKRIVLMRQATNSGAYAARNVGLAASSGSFITVHDDDDWSHPQKIERQVSHLIEHPLVLANMSRHARTTPDLRFVRINNNPAFSQPNFSSIMVRREVFDQIGPWDTVNRSGDSEFRDRLHAFTKTTVEVVGQAPMSFTRTRSDSLTAGEMSRGYVDPARRFYMESYLKWHNRVVDAKSVSKNIETRPFTIPLNMNPSFRGKYFGTYDVVYATDFRFPGGTTSLTVREVIAAHKSGLRVGIVQLDSPMNKPATPMSPLVSELLGNSITELLSLNDNADIRLLVVRHPTVVQFADQITSNLKARKLIMIVNNTPILRGGRGGAYDIAECTATLERIFNVSCEVVPESGVTRAMCEKLVGKDLMAKFDWLGFVAMSNPATRSTARSKPMVGRHSRDHLVKWPNTKAELYDAYVQPAVFSTRILGGAASIEHILESKKHESVQVLPFGAMNPSDFLADLDFWVYFHSDSYAESFGMAPAEAMAAGLVVILPHYMKSTFGSGAVYCKPSEVADTVSHFWANPEAYSAQSRAALDFIDLYLSEHAYTARLNGTIPRELVSP